MSRSGYGNDLDQWELIRWRGAVTSAIRGERGQCFLLTLLGALDGMTHKRLVKEELKSENGEVCALGCVAEKLGLPIDNIDPHDFADIAKTFGISEALAREIVFENDEGGRYVETPEHRYERMRDWILTKLELETNR